MYLDSRPSQPTTRECNPLQPSQAQEQFDYRSLGDALSPFFLLGWSEPSEVFSDEFTKRHSGQSHTSGSVGGRRRRRELLSSSKREGLIYARQLGHGEGSKGSRRDGAAYRKYNPIQFPHANPKRSSLLTPQAHSLRMSLNAEESLSIKSFHSSPWTCYTAEEHCRSSQSDGEP